MVGTLSWSVTESSWLYNVMRGTPVWDGSPRIENELCVVRNAYLLNGNDVSWGMKKEQYWTAIALEMNEHNSTAFVIPDGSWINSNTKMAEHKFDRYLLLSWMGRRPLSERTFYRQTQSNNWNNIVQTRSRPPTSMDHRAAKPNIRLKPLFQQKLLRSLQGWWGQTETGPCIARSNKLPQLERLHKVTKVCFLSCA